MIGHYLSNKTKKYYNTFFIFFFRELNTPTVARIIRVSDDEEEVRSPQSAHILASANVEGVLE
jgi:hypothetical protein